MRHAGSITPALPWRAFFVFMFALRATVGAAPASAPPELAQVGKPDAAEAARLLEQFRQAGIPGEYFLEFELRALPRRGAEKTFRGKLWGSRNAQGAITRVELVDGAGAAHRLLVQNGVTGAVWREVGGQARKLGVAELFAPLIPGVEVTAFDLQMPFLYWPDATLEKIARTVLGRTANAYLVRAPAAFVNAHPDVVAARAYLDAQFNALVQTELLGPGNRVVKTFAFLSLKRVGDHYVPKMADYRNEVTRDKTRLLITGAALDLTLAPGIFEPAQLAQPASPPPAARIVPLEP